MNEFGIGKDGEAIYLDFPQVSLEAVGLCALFFGVVAFLVVLFVLYTESKK